VSSRTDNLAKWGQPDAMFISVVGLWNELLSGVGLKVWTMSFLWFWLTRIIETLELKGQLRRGSYSPFMRTKKRDR